MKIFACLSFLLLTALGASARDTAYQALRLLGKQRGQAILNHVIQVEGRGGAPQPPSWKILVDDPSARAGVREFEIANGQIISERTPLRGYAGTAENAVIDFGKLNLDSAGAFTVAEQEATKGRVSFDKIDYVLRRDDAGASPVWVIRLIDVNRINVATYVIAADTGAVVQSSGSDTARIARDGDVTWQNDTLPPTGTTDDAPSDHRNNPFHQMDKALHRIGGSLEKFFTGKRTVDRRFQDEP